MARPRPYPEVQQGLKVSLRNQRKSKEKHLPRNYTEKHGRRNASIFLVRALPWLYSSFFPAPALLSSSRMRGSIFGSLFLWIPAYAGMTGESLRNPVPELVEECPRTFVILANAGIHSLLSFRVFPCSSVANSSSCPIVADASSSERYVLILH